MKSETCLWKQRHLMPLISEVVKWRGRVSLISEAVIRGNLVSDFRGIEGEGRWGRASLISETVKRGVRMSHAQCSGPTWHALWTIGFLPLHCATLHMHHVSMHHAPLSLHHAILHVHHAAIAFQQCNCHIAPILLLGECMAQGMYGARTHGAWCMGMDHWHGAWGMAYRIMVHRSHPSC